MEIEKICISLSLSKGIIDKMKQNAKSKGMSYSAYITMLINQDKDI